MNLHWDHIKAMVDWRGSAALDIAIDDAIESAPEGVRVALRVPADGPHGPEWTQAVTSGDDYTEGRADRDCGMRPLGPTSPARAARYWAGYLGAVPLR